MKRSNEEKILKELIDKVIEKDRNIKERHEEDALLNATFETLQEMTELSAQEIKQMEKDIRLKMKKRAKIKTIIYSASAVFIILLLLVLFITGNKESYENKLVFKEEFNNNSNKWKLLKDFSYDKYIEEGKYIIKTGENEHCFDHKMKLQLPERFTLEVTTNCIEAGNETYGIRLKTGNFNEFSFHLHPDNKTFIDPSVTSRGKLWVQFPVATEKGKKTVVQKIDAAPIPRESVYDQQMGKIKYFVNDAFIEEKFYSLPETGNMTLFVCGSQSVSFDHIKLTNNSSGKVLVNGPFGELKEMLPARFEYYAISTLENGQYIFKTDKKGKCFKSTIPYPLNNKTKIKLKSCWIGGETYNYGIIAETDDENYYAFELKSDGTACFIKHVKGENDVFTDDIETGLGNLKDKEVTQTFFINGDEIELFLNDQFILKHTHTLKELKKIGFRVCGTQQVAFDHLEIWE
jgi:hypothetical protein